jgi:hypothetical protein
MVLLGNGDGTFQPPVSFYAGDPSNLLLGQFRSGSGVIDVAVSNRFDNTVSVLLGNGDGTFQDPVRYSVGSSSFYPAISAEDFNQDGNLDLVATNFGGGTVSVLLGNGDGTFQAPTSYGVGSQPDQVMAADFNGDGFPDLAVNNFGSNSVSILLNDQIWGPAPQPSGGRGSASPLPLGQGAAALIDADLSRPLSPAPAPEGLALRNGVTPPANAVRPAALATASAKVSAGARLHAVDAYFAPQGDEADPLTEAGSLLRL